MGRGTVSDADPDRQKRTGAKHVAGHVIVVGGQVRRRGIGQRMSHITLTRPMLRPMD